MQHNWKGPLWQRLAQAKPRHQTCNDQSPGSTLSGAAFFPAMGEFGRYVSAAFRAGAHILNRMRGSAFSSRTALRLSAIIAALRARWPKEPPCHEKNKGDDEQFGKGRNEHASSHKALMKPGQSRNRKDYFSLDDFAAAFSSRSIPVASSRIARAFSLHPPASS